MIIRDVSMYLKKITFAEVQLRERIIHAYDNVQPEFLWGLVIRHIPELKKDIERILAEYEDQFKRENSDMV